MDELWNVIRRIAIWLTTLGFIILITSFVIAKFVLPTMAAALTLFVMTPGGAVAVVLLLWRFGRRRERS